MLLYIELQDGVPCMVYFDVLVYVYLLPFPVRCEQYDVALP